MQTNVRGEGGKGVSCTRWSAIGKRCDQVPWGKYELRTLLQKGVSKAMEGETICFLVRISPISPACGFRRCEAGSEDPLTYEAPYAFHFNVE